MESAVSCAIKEMKIVTFIIDMAENTIQHKMKKKYIFVMKNIDYCPENVYEIVQIVQLNHFHFVSSLVLLSMVM